jgi:hypothetical protein
MPPTNKPTWSLREVKKAINLIDESNWHSDIGQSYAAMYGNTGDRVFLPQLREAANSVYKNPTSYAKRVDKFISKHGPDARFPASSYDDDDDCSGGFTIEPMEENDASLIEPSKESQQTDDQNRCVKPGNDRPGSGKPPFTTVKGRGPGVEHGDLDGPVSRGGWGTYGPSPSWDISLGGGKCGTRGKAKSWPFPKPPSSPVYPESQDNAMSPPFSGDKVGLSNPLDTSVPVSKGVANPGDRVGPEKSLDDSVKNRRALGVSNKYLRRTSDPLGDVSSTLNPYSFGIFALTGAKGRRGWGLSKPTTKVSLKDLIGNKTLSFGLDDGWMKTDSGTISRESRFRSGNPGGYVDEHKAQLEKKSVKAHARKIARHFDGFFRDNEIGIGVEQTPRISGKRLVKELITKALRLSRTRKEEKGTGLKLVFVDISPSCDAIRDACFAAGLAIADEDPNVVVIAHFNGYTAIHGGHIVGNRQKEIPHIWDVQDLEKFKSFLSTGRVSGAVCFGDDDARMVYSLLSHYCPTLWLSPDDEEHCKERMQRQDRDNGRVYDEARMYIIGGVINAQTAVEGLKQLRNKK